MNEENKQNFIQKILSNDIKYFQHYLKINKQLINCEDPSFYLQMFQLCELVIEYDNKILLDLLLNFIPLDDNETQELTWTCGKYVSYNCLTLLIEEYNFIPHSQCFHTRIIRGRTDKYLNCLKILIENGYKFPENIINQCYDAPILEYILSLKLNNQELKISTLLRIKEKISNEEIQHNLYPNIQKLLNIHNL